MGHKSFLDMSSVKLVTIDPVTQMTPGVAIVAIVCRCLKER